MLVIHTHPIAQPLPALLKGLMQPWLLVRSQDCRNSVFAARQNSFRFAKIDCATIRQFVVNLLKNRANLLVLVRRQLHLRTPSVGGIAKPPNRVTLATHLVFGRAHDQKCARHRARNKTCENEKSDFPSTSGIHV